MIRSEDDRYEWIPLKEYAADRGVSPRTVNTWIHAQRVTARRMGEMPRSPWEIRVVKLEPARSA